MFTQRSIVFLSLILLGLGSGWQAAAQLPPEVQAQMWRAEWIASEEAPARDEAVLHFRKAIELAEQPQHFIVQVSADNQFVLYVNQVRVGSGPARGNLAHWRYETFDLATVLKPGKNVLAATVWNFGARAPLKQISDRTAFLLQGAGAAEKIVDTNASWEVSEEKGIRTLPPPAEFGEFYFVAEPCLRTDGKVWDWAWDSVERSKRDWKKVFSIGQATTRGATLQNNNWQLIPDGLPPMEMVARPGGRVVRAAGVAQTGDFPAKELAVPAHAKVTILLDNAELTTAYPELTVSGGAGASIKLSYTEALVDAKGIKGNRNEIEGKHLMGVFDEFLPDGADGRVFMPLVWRTWRYLQLEIATGEQPLRLTRLRSWFSAFPFEEKARFDAGDQELQKIWEIGWRTARLDAHDTYMDTPYWEQMQYIGDTRIQALVSYAVAGDDRLARQAMQAFNDSRIPEGITRSRYPTSMFQAIPPFSLLWVGMLHDFWMYRGDKEFLQTQLSGSRSVMDWFLQQQRGDGLLRKLPWWSFADWGEDFGFGIPPQDEDGGSSILTLQYVEALRDAADLEEALGDPARAANYREAAMRAVAATMKLCWNGEYGLLADTPAQKHFSQHANILGVWLDAIPAEQQAEVLTRILSASDAGFKASRAIPKMTLATYYFRFYLTRALEHAGLGNNYLGTLDPWRKMVSLGLTTWAEQPEPTRSDSHAWSAHPNFDLLRLVAGIRPGAPAFAGVIVEPHLGALKDLVASQPHPRGKINVEYHIEGGTLKGKIELPAGVSGEFRWGGKKYALHEGKQEVSADVK